MKKSNQLTTIQIDYETSSKLGQIAALHERSKAGQLRFWVNREYTELIRQKLLPELDIRKLSTQDEIDTCQRAEYGGTNQSDGES